MTPYLRSSSLKAALSSAALLTVAGAEPALAADHLAADEADNVVVTAPGITTTTPVEASGTLPNRFLLRSGMFTLGAAYVPALVVAVESERSEDKHLYAPVVGPWFDLAARGQCSGDCSGETLDKALLVTDGVFQGLGALQIIGAFVLPESRALALHDSNGSPALAFSVAPVHFGRGSNGVMAVGHF